MMSVAVEDRIKRAAAAVLSIVVVICFSGCYAFGVRKSMDVMNDRLINFNKALNEYNDLEDGVRVRVGFYAIPEYNTMLESEDLTTWEAGILTDEPEIVEQAMNQFDEVWMGKHCKTCKRRDFCPDPIA